MWRLPALSILPLGTGGTANPPPLAAFNTCNSGINCWKTDLDSSYELNSTQNLLSPNINLAGLSAPVVVTWAQRYQLENASFDHYNVDFQQVGGATPVRLFEWLGPTMTDAPGNPAVNLGATAGWATFSRRADPLAGLNSELKFHADGDNVVVLSGVAIDDVSVTACRAASADLSIAKTDGVATAVPGGSVTYTIAASNAGGDPVTGPSSPTPSRRSSPAPGSVSVRAAAPAPPRARATSTTPASTCPLAAAPPTPPAARSALPRLAP